MEVFSSAGWKSGGWGDEVETAGSSHSGGAHQTDQGKGHCQICQFTKSLSSTGPLFFGKDTCYTFKFLQWGSNKHLLSVNTIANVFMLNEQVMSAGFKEQVSLFLDLQIMSGFFSFFFF